MVMEGINLIPSDENGKLWQPWAYNYDKSMVTACDGCCFDVHSRTQIRVATLLLHI